MCDYCLLKDSNIEECKKFIDILEIETNSKWTIFHSKDYGKKNLIHYLRFIFFPLKVFFRRKKIHKIILAWQQYYGLLYAFYCRLFHVKKVNSTIIMTFIYKQSKGLLGRIKFKIVRFAVKSKYIDRIIVTTNIEKDKYEKIFHTNKFMYINWGIENIYKKNENYQNYKSNYVVSIGRSNRDYDFLYNFAKLNEDINFIVITDSFNKKLKNFQILDNCYGDNMIEILSNSFCIIIPLDNEEMASGQLVLLQSMAIGVPVIVSKSSAMNDYTNFECGLIFEKNYDELRCAIEKLRDYEFFKKNVNNSFKFFENNFTLECMADKFAQLIREVTSNGKNNI